MPIRRVFSVYKHAALLVVSFCLLCPLVQAQILKVPEIDVFGGYSYLRFGGSQLGFPGALNLNGGNVEVSVHVYQGFGIVADFSGHSSQDLEEYNFLIGGQYKFDVKNLHFYGHGLGGKARTRLENIGASQGEPSSLGGAALLGGGFEVPWKDRIVFRPVQLDYLLTGAFGDKFKSLRVSTGIVFRFGKLPKKEPGL